MHRTPEARDRPTIIPKVARIHRLSGHAGYTALCFNADGTLFAAGSSLDGHGEVVVYKTADAAVVSRLSIPSSGIYSVSFHPSGKTLASGGADGVVRLSDPATGKLIKEFIPVPLTTAGK